VKFLAIAVLAVFLYLVDAPASRAQETDTNTDATAVAQKLYDAKQWEQLVTLTNGSGEVRAEISYLRGMALMRLERYAEAREAFSAAHSAAPREPRFLVERAGAEYRLKDFASAKRDLRRALREDPNDEYALDFLGTIYLLENNLDAALKYWNRAGKPRLASFALEPRPRLGEKLAKSAVAFNAPQILERTAWLATDRRLENLGVFPRRRLELIPAGEQDYSAILHLSERDGRDNFGWTGLISLLSGAPYQTVYPEWYNIGSRAINFSSMTRWDAQKRRVFASLGVPLEGRADRSLTMFVDGRDENWNLSQTFAGSTSSVDNLNLRRLQAGAELRFVINGNWNWSAGAAVIGRKFRNAGTVTSVDTSAILTSGTSLEGWAGITHTLLRAPERRFLLTGTANSQVGRGYKDALGPFGALGGSLQGEWFPHASGDQDSLNFQVRAANLFGTVALDQLYELGLDRDSPLWLRGHAATIDGKKGRAPLGKRFVLINMDYDRTLYDGGFFRLQAGPLLDMGKITDPSGALGDPRWLLDTGVQVKLRVLGAVSVVLSYGRDLRNGRGTIFGTTERR